MRHLVIMLGLILFLNSCANNKDIKIAEELLIPVKKPKPPKTNALIPKKVAIFILDLDEALDKANLKIVTLAKILNNKDSKNDLQRSGDRSKR